MKPRKTDLERQIEAVGRRSTRGPEGFSNLLLLDCLECTQASRAARKQKAKAAARKQKRRRPVKGDGA